MARNVFNEINIEQTAGENGSRVSIPKQIEGEQNNHMHKMSINLWAGFAALHWQRESRLIMYVMNWANRFYNDSGWARLVNRLSWSRDDY